jgi:dipeptidyl aminopeptidase/acylaminoacyl peptidase
MTRYWRVRLVAALACFYTPLIAAAGQYPSNEDLRHVRNMSDPHISPDGQRAIVSITDASVDGGRSHLWLIDVAKNTSRQLTWSPASDKGGEHQGRWLQNDAVLFLAKRTEHTQLFRLPMAGGEAHAFELSIVPPVDASLEPDAIPPRSKNEPAKPDPLPLDVEDFQVAPDGRTIALLARDPETPGEKKQKEDKADAVWVDHDLHGKRLYLLNPDSGKLMPAAVPPDVSTVIWATASDRLVALAEGPNNSGDLGPDTTAWLVVLADPGHPTRIKELPSTIENAVWSDDGSRFYFLAQAARDTPPSYSDLYLMNWGDRSIRNLSADFLGSFTGPRPVLVERDVMQPAEFGTGKGYVRVRANKLENVPFDAPNVSGLDCDAKHVSCIWLGQGSGEPPALYFGRRPGRDAQRLNTPELLPAKWTLTAAKIVHWRNEGQDLEGLLFMPEPAGAKMPLIVDVHGGPTGVWSSAFEPMVQFFLGQGWAVFRPNPRGSSGYGAAFAAANKNDLGGGDLRDIMSGTDAVIAQFPIDDRKLALVGYSYGGEMAGFVEGKTDRFKAIVSGAPVIDQQSEYGTESNSWYDRWFYGKPWDHAEAAWRQSPLAHVAAAKTPFLLIQGESDVTDPLDQSREMYRALRQVGVHVEMMQYPREGHSPLSAGMRGFPSQEPWHGFDVRQRVVKFISAAFAQ